MLAPGFAVRAPLAPHTRIVALGVQKPAEASWKLPMHPQDCRGITEAAGSVSLSMLIFVATTIVIKISTVMP